MQRPMLLGNLVQDSLCAASCLFVCLLCKTETFHYTALYNGKEEQNVQAFQMQ